MTGTNTYEIWSGTSMASPHAAGVAALYMQANASATPVQVTAAIVNGATTGVLSNIGTGSPNRLLYSRLTTIAPPSPPAAPSALVATAVNSSSISLSWQDNSDNELGFKIERSDNGSSGWLQVGIVGAGIKTFANTGLAAQTRYYYRVCAYNNDGNSVYSNTADAVTPAATSVTVFVENLYGFATTNPAGWFGNLEVTVFNSNNTAQSGVSVNVSWSGAVSGSASAVTGSNGKCTITTQRIGKNVPGSVTMTVTNLSGTGVTYAPLSNKEKFETIYKP
jgi:hypothetical protein